MLLDFFECLPNVFGNRLDNRRIIRELDKKNNEIYLLRDTLDGKAGKLREVKRKLTTAEHDKHNLEERNEQLQTKLAEAIEICASLIEHTPKFTTTAAAKRDQDVLSVSGKLIDKAKHFLVGKIPCCCFPSF